MEALHEPTFRAGDIVQSSVAAKSFGAVRRMSKTAPVLIMDRGKADSVLVSFEAYRTMFGELEGYREESMDRIAEKRLLDHSPVPFEQSELDAIVALDPEAISDAELFE